MKWILLCLALISTSAFADRGESRTFTYNGSQDHVEMILRGEETHTEYRVEQRRSTCSRTVIVGYRRTCTGPNRPGGPRVCRDTPVYRTEYYPCWITVRVPYEVKDFDVEATVRLDVSKLPEYETTGETFKITLDGDKLTLEATGSKRYFLMLNRQNVRTQISGMMKYLDADYAVELVEASGIVKAIKMSSISIENDTLKFNMGPINSRDNLGFALRVAQVRTIGSDPVLFDRELTPSEIEIRTMNNSSEAGVNVTKLGLELSGGKFSLTSKVFYKHGGVLLNPNQFGELEASRTLIYTNR